MALPEKFSRDMTSLDNGSTWQIHDIPAPTGPRAGRVTSFLDSFRRTSRQSTGFNVIDGHEKGYDAEAAIRNTERSPLARKLKGRHLQMIAIGGSIGSGLFVGSGKALAAGGPASLLIGYGLIGIMLYCTVYALGEMAICFPVAGAFSAYATRFLDPAWGFAMGSNYALNWLITLPLEIVSASITIQYWNHSISQAVWVTIFLIMIISINLFGVKGYGEAEFTFSIIKVVAVVGFILLGIVLNIGGTVDGGYIGGKYWHDPGPFVYGFKGLCSTFVTAAFSFSGTELVGLAAAETANPPKSMPKAVKQVFWRITLFYMVALTLVGLLVPYTDKQLLSGSSVNASASPFVIAIQNAGISVLPSVMNVVILISVLSVGNSSIYGSSRTLAAMAEQRQLPRMFAYIDRKGRPLVSLIFSSAVGLIAYLAVLSDEVTVFSWLVAISGLSAIFTWMSICLCHIRFRAAWKAQGHKLDELSFTSQPGLIGSWVGFIFNLLIFVAQFWTAFAPEGYGSMSTNELVINFFEAYLAAPIIVVCYFGYKFWFKTKWVRTMDIDLNTGIKDVAVQAIIEMEKRDKVNWPRWKKIYSLFC